MQRRDSRDVDVCGLSDSLVIDSRVGHDDDSRLLETLRDVIGKVTRSESTSNGLGTSESSVFQDCSMSIWSSRDDTDIVRVVNRSEDSSCKDELFPSLANVQNVDT